MSIAKVSNAISQDFPLIQSYIEYYAKVNPDSIALASEEETLTYFELNKSANNLANYLISQGIGPEKTVGIFLNPSINLVIAVIAVLKAGGVYVPIAPTLPKKRAEYILKDSKAKILLTDFNLKSKFSFDSVISVAVDNNSSNEILTNPKYSANESNAAFIIYTSGSTGKPKGVVIEHRNLSYYIKWYIKNIFQKMQVDLPLTSSMSFAAAVTQFYSSLVLGRTLHILNPDLLRQPDDLFEWYNINHDFGLYCVPTLWEELINYAEINNKSKKLKSPKCVFLSGEAVSNSLVKRTYNLFPNIQLWNLYGPTEATANISAGLLSNDKEVDLGEVIEGSKLFILNDNLEKIGINETGEIYIAGDGIARGYLNLPRLTGQYFFNHQFNDGQTLRLYKTGDLAKYDENNKIIFLGRKDSQIKINGYRIELSEIENILLQHYAIRQTVVIKKSQGTNNQLIAYIVVDKSKSIIINDVRDYLKEQLPDYMMPNVIVFLDSFPKLKNGKINRKKLPQPGIQRPDLRYSYVPPGNDLEKELVAIWEDVLGYAGLGINDNFFDLGGNSLKIISIIYRINGKFNVKIPFRYFFKYQTPYKLAKILKNEEIQDRTINLEIKKAISPSYSYPLSVNQESLWFIMQSIPNKSLYNILLSIEMKGEFNLSYLQLSLEDLTKKHKQLNAVFNNIDGELVCRIKENNYIGIEFFDLSNIVSNEQIKSSIEDIQNSELQYIFDLETGPLYKFKVIKVNKNRHILLVLIHHIIFDGWSVNVFVKELSDLYSTLLNNSEENIQDLDIQFTDYAHWQKENIDSSYYARMLKYWQEKLKNSNFVLDFPADFARQKNQTFNGNYKKVFINKDVQEKIWKFNKKNNLTPFMTFLSLFKLLLFKYTKQNDILVGCPVANRNHKEVENLIGYFVNTIIIRTNLSDELTFNDLLSEIKETTIESLDNQAYPFAKLVENLNIERSASISPVFQVMFAYHDAFLDTQAKDNISFSVREIHNPAAKFDLVLELEDIGSGLELRLTYNSDLFKESTINRLLSQYQHLLSSVIKNTTKQLSEYSLIDEKLILAKYQELNKTQADYSRNKGIHQLFEEQAVKTPNSIALIFEDKKISYNELNTQANKLARYILTKNVNRKSPIGVQMETSEKVIISLLAILKIGSPYIPLDPYYPKDRNKYIIEHSGVELIITDDNYCDTLSNLDITILNIDKQEESTSSFSDNNISLDDFSSNDLAYIIYTSGSTGNPKGVMVSHQPVCNYLQWMQRTFPMNEVDKILNRTSINFDISVWEIFLPIICGAKLVLARKDILQAPESLYELIKNEGITNLQFVPSSLKIFLDSGLLSSCKSIKRIFSGGEKLSIKLQNQVSSEFDGELINFYGPTEATIYATYWECQRDSKLSYVPIGKPISNAEVYVLDDNLKALPQGIVGELYIGGEVLAKGYYDSPELTEKSFIQSPFEQHKTLYKTGDLVKLSDDGNIEFLGRVDNQVKVRGYRIELEEIEYYLISHHKIKQAVVIIREDIDSDVRIVAYLIPQNSNLPNENELRSYLKEKLPSYMIPSFFISIDSIPFLANGKLNINALPSIKSITIGKTRNNYNNKYEEMIAEIWKVVLGTDNFKPDDNFYEVGGHSLLMVKVQNLIQEKLNLKVSVVDLFQYPNIQSLANYFIEKYKTKGHLNSDIMKRVAMRKKVLTPKIKKIIEKYNHDKSK